MRKSVQIAVIGAGVLCLSLGTAMGQLNHQYSFNTDGLADDSVGSADGTIVGDAVVAAGQATMNFGARDGIIDLPAATIGVNAYSALTFEVWATPDSALNSSFSTLLGFGKVNGTDPGLFGEYLLLQTHRGDNASRAAVSLSDDGSPWDEEDGANGAELNDNVEHHYVGVWDSTSVSLYVDGVFAASSPYTISGPNALSGVSTETAWIGDAYPNDQNWAGSLNEFRIYGNPVPAWAIADNFAAGPDGAITVPEPATFALAGFGLLGMLMMRRRS